MDLTSKITVRNLLKKYGIRPSRRLGQNFLIDRGIVRKIIEAADLKPQETVLEIGPGMGTLTQELAERAKKVIAVEKDPKMLEVLKETLKDFGNIEIIQGDIRFLEIRSPKYKVVANLPFYLTAPVIRKFLELVDIRYQPTEMVLVVQKEVGQRIVARPPKMSLLAVSVQIYSDPKIISYISKKSFWPQPEVDGTILKISNLKSQISKIDKNLFFQIVKAGFSQPRKQLINNLSSGLRYDKKKVRGWLLENGVQPTQRAQSLTIKDWTNLTKTFVVPR